MRWVRTISWEAGTRGPAWVQGIVSDLGEGGWIIESIATVEGVVFVQASRAGTVKTEEAFTVLPIQGETACPREPLEE